MVVGQVLQTTEMAGYGSLSGPEKCLKGQEMVMKSLSGQQLDSVAERTHASMGRHTFSKRKSTRDYELNFSISWFTIHAVYCVL